MKSPAFQFYPDDFVGSGKVGTMTTEEVGTYTLLLCLDWNETGFVYDEEELARWCKLSRAKFRKAWVRVSRCFVERDGRLFNPRLEAERTKQAEWREKSRKGGIASGEARAKGGSTTLEPDGQANGNTPSPSPTPVTARSTDSGADAPPKTRTIALRPSGPAPDVLAVLEYYRARHPRRKPGPKELTLIGKALSWGYSASDLREAIDGNADDPWHAEKGKHDLGYVLRDRGHIDDARAKHAAQSPVELRDGWFADVAS